MVARAEVVARAPHLLGKPADTAQVYWLELDAAVPAGAGETRALSPEHCPSGGDA